MSKTAIWSLNAPRHELGGATKGTIYVSKIGIGAVIAIGSWLASFVFGLSPDVVIFGSLVAFVTEKVCYYLNARRAPTDWDDWLDWVCDGALAFAWLALWTLLHGSWPFAAGSFALWLVTYPFSCE